MNRWPPRLLHGWFVVAESRRLAHRPLATSLMDRPIVLARMECGTPVAMEDRCPHRHYPLSAGRINDKGLQCGYHGWTFDTKGRCIEVPGMLDAASVPKVNAKVLDVIEHDGLIWVRTAPRKEESSPGLPSMVAHRAPGALRFVQRLLWQGDALDALENFLDPLHTHFTHPGLVRREDKRRPVEALIRETTEGITVDYEGHADQSGLLHRLVESPRTLERAHHARSAPGTACIEYRYRNGSMLVFTLHFTPLRPWQTQVHATLHAEGRWAPSWAVRYFAWPFLRRVARQDQRAIERQALNRQRFGTNGGMGASSEIDLLSAYLRNLWTSNEDKSTCPRSPETARVLLKL